MRLQHSCVFGLIFDQTGIYYPIYITSILISIMYFKILNKYSKYLLQLPFVLHIFKMTLLSTNTNMIVLMNDEKDKEYV